MIIDTTLFNNEFHMLDIRIALTESWVDRWVICEGNRTMSGKPKPYHLSDNIERYAHLGNRLRVIKLDIPETWTNWDIENGQRAALMPGYADVGNNDIVMHSDLDEILNPELVPEILAEVETQDKPITCTLEMYIYRFDQKLNRTWAGNVVAKKRHFDDPCHLYKGVNAGVGHAQKKKDRSHCGWYPKMAGWHWGWMGNDDIIKSKIVSCIESQHKDTDQTLAYFHAGDTGSAINQKCVTVYQENPNYPASVDAVLRQYPFWTNGNQG
jgi:beta-1,4-mannosyl-glycoprotein beta-1,4-N-acetylglucosaminyltransferase